MLSLEDDPAAVVRGRLDAAGADLTRICSMSGVLARNGEERDAILPADLDAMETPTRGWTRRCS
jgi:hypothetical protein